MKQTRIFTTLIALVALLVATIALMMSREARSIARSEIRIEERNALTTPVYDEETEQWSFLAVFELSFTNVSGPEVQLARISTLDQGGGFVLPLKGDEVMDTELNPETFLVDPTLVDIRNNPALVRDLDSGQFEGESRLDLTLPHGQTKTIRLGTMVYPYLSESREQKATMILASFEFRFSTGKTDLFRRGFAIPRLQSSP